MQTFDEWFYSTPAGSTKMVCESFYEDVSDCVTELGHEQTAYSQTIMKDWLKDAFSAAQQK